MEDEVYYNMDKNDAEGMAEKKAMEAAKKRVESLERVKDIVAQSLLEPETYEQVYKPAAETLSQGNAASNNPPKAPPSSCPKWQKTSIKIMECR